MFQFWIFKFSKITKINVKLCRWWVVQGSWKQGDLCPWLLAGIEAMGSSGWLDKAVLLYNWPITNPLSPQGSATVGIKGKNHSVLVALKRASSDLSSHQKKIIPIDDHAGISIAGKNWLNTADCRPSFYVKEEMCSLVVVLVIMSTV